MFNQIKQITLTTSSRRPNDILQNALLRIQGNTQTFSPEVNSEIAKLASILPAKENKYFSWEWIKQNRVHYQAHLERVSDYLQHQRGVWWDYPGAGIEFMDTLPSEQGITHFSSTTTAEVLSSLQTTWQSLCETNVLLLIHEVKAYGELGTKQYSHQFQDGEEVDTQSAITHCNEQPEDSTSIADPFATTEGLTTLSKPVQPTVNQSIITQPKEALTQTPATSEQLAVHYKHSSSSYQAQLQSTLAKKALQVLSHKDFKLIKSYDNIRYKIKQRGNHSNSSTKKQISEKQKKDYWTGTKN